MSDIPVDPKRCPLCGQDNRCSAAAGETHVPCWCMTASFPDALLESIPPERRMKACICKSCLQVYRSRTDAERHGGADSE